MRYFVTSHRPWSQAKIIEAVRVRDLINYNPTGTSKVWLQACSEMRSYQSHTGHTDSQRKRTMRHSESVRQLFTAQTKSETSLGWSRLKIEFSVADARVSLLFLSPERAISYGTVGANRSSTKTKRKEAL